MTENIDETKVIIDEETVEQLVEDRPIKKVRPDGSPAKKGGTGKKRRKKKKNHALKIVIVLFAIIILFILSFLVASNFFASSMAFLVSINSAFFLGNLPTSRFS